MQLLGGRGCQGGAQSPVPKDMSPFTLTLLALRRRHPATGILSRGQAIYRS